MSLAEDIAGALAAMIYRRVGLVTTLAAGACEDEGCVFSELHQNAVAAALVAAFDGTEATLRDMLEIDAAIRTDRLEIPDA